jgi:lysophospholipase L1-like esterase
MASSPLEEVGAARGRYTANLRQILSRLREVNPRAPVYVVGLYDPFGEEGPQARLGASVILSWNTLIGETALSFPKVFVVPTFDLFQGRPDRLAVDRFHPNGRGHQAIADRILQSIPSS